MKNIKTENICIEINPKTFVDLIKKIDGCSRIIWANTRTHRNPNGNRAASVLEYGCPPAKYLQVDPGGLNYYNRLGESSRLVTEEELLKHCRIFWRK